MAISVEEARAMTEEQLQETITEMAFEIIANVGTARGMYIEAIQEAKAGHFDQAAQLLKDGKEAFVEGHHGHADLLEWQGQGLTWKSNIYLLHAEALAFQDDIDGALIWVNRIRKRAQLPEYKRSDILSAEDMCDKVLHERRLELSFEGHRFFGLVRFGKAAEVCDGANVPGSASYDAYVPTRRPMTAETVLLPVPTAQIDNNSNLTQNPGY